MSKPTKEEILAWLGCYDNSYIVENSRYSKEWNQKIREAIRRLIEGKPSQVGVDGEFVEKWGALIMPLSTVVIEHMTEKDKINFEKGKILVQMLLKEIPVRIKEEK
jgi:hypothetical protein